MPLVVEDGSIVAGANSYVSVADIQAFAALRDLTVGESDADIEIHATLAMDYLQLRDWKGSRIDKTTQELDWPRKDIFDEDCDEYANDAIPQEIKDAQCWLAHYAFEDIQLFIQPSNEFNPIGMTIEKTVGPLTKRYSDRILNGWSSAAPDGTNRIAIVEALLKPFVKSYIPLRTIRI